MSFFLQDATVSIAIKKKIVFLRGIDIKVISFSFIKFQLFLKDQLAKYIDYSLN